MINSKNIQVIICVFNIEINNNKLEVIKQYIKI